MYDTWGTMLAMLMPSQVMDQWIDIADQHLVTVKELRDRHLADMRHEYFEEKFTAMAVQRTVSNHCIKFGFPPGGDFALTVLQALKQYQEALQDQPATEDHRLPF